MTVHDTVNTDLRVPIYCTVNKVTSQDKPGVNFPQLWPGYTKTCYIAKYSLKPCGQQFPVFYLKCHLCNIAKILVLHTTYGNAVVPVQSQLSVNTSLGVQEKLH